MSKGKGPIPDLAIEYSSRGLAVYDPRTATTQSFRDLAAAGATYSGRTVVIGLSRRSVFLRTVRVPNAAIDEVRQVLMMKAGDLFPVGPGELAMDFRMTDDINEEGRLAIVAAVTTGELRRVREDAKSAGLKVLGITPVAFGSAAVSRAMHLKNAAIVSRDQEGIGIDIVYNGEIRQSRLVTVAAAIEAEVCRTYSLAGLPCGETVAANGVVLKDPEHSTNNSPLAALIDVFPTRIGVDLQLPEELERRTRRAHDARRRFAFLLALAAGAFVTVEALSWNDAVSALDAQQSKLDKNVAFLKAKADKADQDAQTAGANLKTVKMAFQAKQRLGDVVTLVSNRVPNGVWLTGISVERGKEMTIRGTAKNADLVGAYMQALAKEPRLRNIHLVVSDNALVDQVPVQQFSLSLFPVGNLPLASLDKKKTGGAQ